MSRLTISILVHRDFSHIRGAVRSIQAGTRTPYKLYVVINAGEAEQIAALQAEFPDLTYIVNTTPQGFAANHNMIMRRADTPYIALLNDDIAVQGDALDQMIAHLDAQADVGMIGPQLENADGSPQVTAYSAPSLFRMLYKFSGLNRLTHQQSRLRRWLIALGVGKLSSVASLTHSEATRDVAVLKAAAIIVRQSAVVAVGMMDETTLAYGEEIDWDWRMRQAGWRIVILPSARITHYGVGQATQHLNGWQIVEDRKGILNYYIKHRPRREVWVVRGGMATLHGMQAILAVFISWKNIRAHLRTAWMGLTWTR